MPGFGAASATAAIPPPGTGWRRHIRAFGGDTETAIRILRYPRSFWSGAVSPAWRWSAIRTMTITGIWCSWMTDSGIILTRHPGALVVISVYGQTGRCYLTRQLTATALLLTGRCTRQPPDRPGDEPKKTGLCMQDMADNVCGISAISWTLAESGDLAGDGKRPVPIPIILGRTSIWKNS